MRVDQAVKIPDKKEVDCSCVNPFTVNPEAVPCLCGARELMQYNKVIDQISALELDPRDCVEFDREELAYVMKTILTNKWRGGGPGLEGTGGYYCHEVADAIISAKNKILKEKNP